MIPEDLVRAYDTLELADVHAGCHAFAAPRSLSLFSIAVGPRKHAADSGGPFGSTPPVLALAGILTSFRFHLPPELLVGNAARLLDLAAGFVEQRLELGRVRQHQP